VFVLWLRNQHYYTHDVIGIKMTHKDLSYYEGIRAPWIENKHKNHANSLHTFRKWSITWSLSGCTKCRLICHWHAQPYKLTWFRYNKKIADQARNMEVWRKPVAVLCRFIPSMPLLLQWLCNFPLVAQWINFCLMYILIVLD